MALAVAAGAGGNWSHSVYSEELERDQCWGSARFLPLLLFFSPRPQSMRLLHPIGSGTSFLRSAPRNALPDTLRCVLDVCLPGDCQSGDHDQWIQEVMLNQGPVEDATEEGRGWSEAEQEDGVARGMGFFRWPELRENRSHRC